MSGWSTISERVKAYLQTRRALGYQLRSEGEQLQRFARFAEQHGHCGPLTLEIAVAWANLSCTVSGLGRARRLEVIRPLAKYCALFEPETEIPPPNLLGPGHRRLMPYIYSDQELMALLDAAQSLRPEDGLRPATMRCLIGLLAATGLRISEALHLNQNDVDLDQGVLHIRDTKFRKSRLVPLHPTARQALADYLSFRDHCQPLSQDQAFFLFDNGRAVNGAQARYAFGQIRSRLDWASSVQGRRPRLYDLRHTFACRRLLSWHQENQDVNALIPHLATYLGHAKVSDTYWYLTGTADLLGVAARRFEQSTQQDPGEQP